MNQCLVVDDSRTIRRAIIATMKDLSFEFQEAGDGLEAIEKCKSRMPYLIILDWNMPNMTGIEFLRNLRRMTGGEKPKVILCTTETGLNFIQEALKCGADEYIMKPFTNEIIKEKLKLLRII